MKWRKVTAQKMSRWSRTNREITKGIKSVSSEFKVSK
jgi:hypothetical protein